MSHHMFVGWFVICCSGGRGSHRSAAGAAICWAGSIRGTLRVGLVELLERLENLLTASGSDISACDIVLHQWHRKDPKLVSVPPESLGRQHVHEGIGWR